MAIDSSTTPKHVAIVMDGNGRWAQTRGKNRQEGHRAGARNVVEIVRHCGDLGITYLTLYAFSSENWKRPRVEVEALMALLTTYLKEEGPKLVENQICFKTIGCIKSLPASIQEQILCLKKATMGFRKQNLILALSYGSRDELVRAARSMMKAVQNGNLSTDEISEKTFSAFLDTADVPDPDLFIRTSGEMRLSNFLLWQLSYSELYFSKMYWPDFNLFHFKQALEFYKERQRRFGLTSEQILAT